MTYEGGLSVKRMWRGEYDPEIPNDIWDKIDAMILIKLRFQLIFFLISIVLTVISIVLSVMALTGK